jgi:hypothetical protein
LRTLRPALTVHAVRDLLWAVGSDLIEPIDDLGIAATLMNEAH